MGSCMSSPERKYPTKSTADKRDSADYGDAPAVDREGQFQFGNNGRRFLAVFDPLAEGNDKNDLIYTLPNDDEEMDRLHLQHYLMRYAFQGR